MANSQPKDDKVLDALKRMQNNNMASISHEQRIQIDPFISLKDKYNLMKSPDSWKVAQNKDKTTYKISIFDVNNKLLYVNTECEFREKEGEFYCPRNVKTKSIQTRLINRILFSLKA